MVRRTDFLLTADELAAELAGPRPPVVLDVRWRLDQPDGRNAFLEAHIPGARYVSLDDVFSGKGRPKDGRHPLPDAGVLVSELSALGISPTDPIVTLDDMQAWAACRAWWVLRNAGFVSVRVLDGGWKAWGDAGLPTESGESPTVEPTEGFELRAELPQLTIDEAAALPHYGTLIDARAAERYRGELEPLDPRAGHIPGAINLPVSQLLTPDGRFKSEGELADMFAGHGVRAQSRVGVYCGSGVSATPLVFALHLVGIEAALYPGSWSQWSNTELRPVAVGGTPDGDVLS